MDNAKILPLVEKAIQGDKNAYASLCEEIIRDVLYMCVKITGNVQHGEDAAQEALVRMGNSIKKLRNPHAFPLWLNRHLASSCRNYLRKEKRHQGQAPEDLFGELMELNTEFLPEQWAEQEDRRALVLSGLQKLPARQQHILLMYYFQGMTTKDIAAANKVTEATARSNLRYARNNLRRQIEKAAGTQLAGLPGMALVPTITLILRRDAALLVSQESCKKVLVAVGAALAAAGGAAAGLQIVTLVASLTPATLALAAVAGTIFVSSPSPSHPPEDAARNIPQYSSAAERQSGGEGDLYMYEPPRGPSEALPSTYSQATSHPSAETPQPARPFEAGGRIVLAGYDADTAIDFSGLVVEAFCGQELAATAHVGKDGAYTICLPDDTQAYTLQIAQTAKPDLDAQSLLVHLPPGQSQVPDLIVEDKVPPECGVVFVDAGGLATDDRPAGARIQVSDVLPCTVQWAVFAYGETQPLREGGGEEVDLQNLEASATRYVLEVSVTDLAGNHRVLRCMFWSAE